MKKYSNKKLNELADADIIWPKKSSSYRQMLKKSLESKGLDISIFEDPDMENDWVHEQLWWDVCKIVNDLAQLVLDEREKTEIIRRDMEMDLRDYANTLKKFNR